MKYIDADKLIAEIERRIEETKSMKPAFDQFWAGQISAFKGAIKIAESLQQEQPDTKEQISHLEHWLAFFGCPEENIEKCATQIAQGYGAIRYLEGVQHGAEAVNELAKQEQPEGLHFTPLNRLIQKIPSKNWNDTVNNYAKKLRDCLIKEGYLKDAKVLQDYISYMNGNNVPMATMDEQEKPEVELEKEIDRFWDSCIKHKNERGGNVIWSNKIEIKVLARHFYELGLNARKEDAK